MNISSQQFGPPPGTSGATRGGLAPGYGLAPPKYPLLILNITRKIVFCHLEKKK